MTAFPFTVGHEVASALADGRPVVALESTIITHGLPAPQNLEMARAVEAVVRARGATPATIALIHGVPTVGLGEWELEALAADRSAGKASSRDIATMIVRGESAGTTVSATMLLAERAGIKVFATGGVGGVHRGAEQTFDVSADLTELGRTPTAVVCAGVKAILDIPKTLEVLETQRVPVIAFGVDEFPAFYTRGSGQKAGQRLDTPEQIARAVALHRATGAGTGLLIANPIPAEDALDAAAIEATIASAVREAERLGVAGKALTPFLLQRINELTAGESLKANIALVKNNANLAARIAVALAALG
ncbi:pseudouridine-5'-phosphate glycosidase [Alsobacter sp. SYSU M60028]|uniref:Pseudouridine-5'-phosphate glycosidase n=1 Tax=Alsobacter ponti TaxID=2962936 RepID=A0ABT1L6V2_9HYPH|nr:pseudouridine-5'-phosphate glycosidase [Alsobacter ponti]MCP8937117.1 pseudouridine-5'-phosphate glycosidase [Alsobacter ponti]